MSLRTYLAAADLFPAADLRAADLRAAIYGGALDTALLELELIDPLRLAELLAAAHGLASAPAGLLAPRPRPWDHLAPRWLASRRVAPLAVLDERLWIAVHPDLDADDLRALWDDHGALEITVAPECCIRQILAERDGEGFSGRYAALAARYTRALRRADPETLTTLGAESRPESAAPPEAAPLPADAPLLDASAPPQLDALAPADPSLTERTTADPPPAAATRVIIPTILRHPVPFPEIAEERRTPPEAAAEPLSTSEPSDTSAPSPDPSDTSAPSPAPSDTSAPSPAPSDTSAPSPAPSDTSAPSPAPSDTSAPSPAPSDTSAPSPAPSDTLASDRDPARPEHGTVLPRLTRPRSEAAPEGPALDLAPSAAAATEPRAADAAPLDPPQDPPAAGPDTVLPRLTRPRSAPATGAAPRDADPSPDTVLPRLTRPRSAPTASAVAEPPPPPPREEDALVPRLLRERSSSFLPTTLVGPGAAAPATTDDAAVAAALAAVAAGARPDEAAAELRARGTAALARLIQLFPGPMQLPRGDLRHLAPPSAQGPLLRLCIAVGEDIAPFILDRLGDPDPNVRFYGALIFQELRATAAAPHLAELAFDDDRDVRTVAMRVLETYGRAPTYPRALQRIRGEFASDDPDRRHRAIQALGTIRDVRSLPRLIDALADPAPSIRGAAITALCSITGQHFGAAAERWRAWLSDHADRHRIDWMIESLGHADVAVRRWAADELMRITGQRLPYPAAGDPDERAAAIDRWRAWWEAYQSRLLG